MFGIGVVAGVIASAVSKDLSLIMPQLKRSENEGMEEGKVRREFEAGAKERI